MVTVLGSAFSRTSRMSSAEVMSASMDRCLGENDSGRAYSG